MSAHNDSRKCIVLFKNLNFAFLNPPSATGTGKTLVALQVANNLMESATDTCGDAGNEPLLVITTARQEEDDPIMKYLDASTGTRTNKTFKSWCNLKKEYGVSGSLDMELLTLTEALSKKCQGRQIVMLLDEITNKSMLSTLGDQSFPVSVRMILVVNPWNFAYEEKPLTLPPSFLHIILTTPYRSTIAITSLACFIAKCDGMVVPEGNIGSDVEGFRPIFFYVGKDERKTEEALAHCRKFAN